jgi:hypothetical protein
LGHEGNSHLGLNTAARLNEHTPAPHLKTFRDHIQPSQTAEAVEQTLGVGEACRHPPVSDVIQWVYMYKMIRMWVSSPPVGNLSVLAFSE